MMKRLVLIAVLSIVAGGLAAEPAGAHEGGKAEPRIAAAVSEDGGLERIVTVRLTDIDSGEPVAGATVRVAAEMTDPHDMRTSPWTLPEEEPGVYQALLRLPMAGTWTLQVGVTGQGVSEARAELRVRVEQGAGAGEVPAGAGELTPLPTTLEDGLTGRDAATMAVLWLHGVAALGWISGVLVMALALSTRPALLAEGVRARLAAAYRNWGAWLHWGFVPVVVGTGIYNMLYVTPFPIAWRPSQFDALGAVPYGPLYEAILIVKLGLFAALLITGTQVLVRTVRPAPTEVGARTSRARPLGRLASILGAPGLVYLACVPLILGAVVALRYVHILSHVAEVVSKS